jgi:hypothetical protein
MFSFRSHSDGASLPVIMKPLTDRALKMLGSRAREYRGWRLFVACSGKDCNRRSVIEVADLPDDLAALTLSEFLQRMKCRQCKEAPGGAELRHHMTKEILLGAGLP